MSLNPMKVIASTTRGALIPGEGCDLLAMDFAGIESRVTSWMAGEGWELDAFLKQDNDGGPDNYEIAWADATGDDPEKVTPENRQKGKPISLAFGFEGGVAALLKMAKTYRVPLEILVKAVAPTLTEDEVGNGEWMIAHFGRQGLDKRTFICLNALKLRWRAKHPRTKQLWRDLKDAAILAVQQPEKTFWIPNRKIAFRTHNNGKHTWLYMRLPSGRKLAYFDPEIHYDTKWCEDCLHHYDVTEREHGMRDRKLKPEFKGMPEEKDPSLRCETCYDELSGFCGMNMGTVQDDASARVTYMGINTDTRQWMRVSSYGGKWCENAVQATARDLLVNGMFRVEARGWPIVMHVHDEVVLEIPKGTVTVDDVRGEMCQIPEWARGLPIAAEGWVGQRYRKD
jgi:DNA polymerase